MSYEKTNWENAPSTNSPINAANLNKIENQLEAPSVLYVDFDTSSNPTHQVGRANWNSIDDTLEIDHSGGVVQQVGEETYARVTNSTGSDFNNGDLIGLTGSGTTVGKYIANGSSPPIYAIGLATQVIANGERGRLTVYGRVRGLNTSNYIVGDVVYANPAIAGGLTNIKPTAPNIVIPVGVVTSVSATDGEIFVRPVLDQQLYYGAFARTTDLQPLAIDTAYPIEFDTTMVSNGVSIGSTPSTIIVSNSGLYSFSASFQLTSTNSSIKNVRMWFRKNGADVPNSTIVRSLESGTAITSQTRSAFFSLAAGDYIELMWGSNDINVLLDARPANAYSPAAPAVALTVDQIQQ